jgi:hypothetical protein
MTRRIVYVVGLLTSAFSVAAAVAETDFTTHLSGRNEVPPVETRAQGEAILHVSEDGSSISFKLVVANIENITAAHIHIAAEGVNGPVVVPLYNGPTISGRFEGSLAEDTFTAANLTGPLAGMTIADLLSEIMAGNAYVNVHTTQNPGGEIRGQL